MRARCLWLVGSLIWFPIPGGAQVASNASLQGSYNFRYLGIIGSPCDCPISFQGTATFDGKGSFQIIGQGTYNNGSDHSLNGPGSGHYTVLSSGALQMDNPFANGSVSLRGGVGVGALVASSTESGYLDLIVAAPAGTASSNATLSGAYQVASLEFAGGRTQATRNTFFSMNADGAGGLGNVTVKGTSQVLKNAATTQMSSGATYTLSARGTGTLTLPAPAGISADSQLLSGAKTFYVSPDGNFFLAGAATGYDLVLGVKSSNNALQGLYFTGLLQNLADGSAGAGLYSAWGSSIEVGDQAANEISHQRVKGDGYSAFDQLFSDTFASNPQYAAGPSGNIVIGTGNAGNYQLSLNVKLANLGGTGVFLNPAGVVNAATNAPFTAPVSPGELISLYGTGLATQTATAASLPFPNTLANVQVSVNGTAAPIYYVSPTLISVQVPYSIPADGSLVTIQVTNDGTPSNSVQAYTAQTSPGIFTLPAGGLGSGAIRHADFTIVSAASPAHVGETVQIYLTGLGAVTPAVAAGAAAPVLPLSITANHVAVYIDKQPATVAFAGLAPTLAGLYQLNVTIPAGVGTGNLDIQVVTVDSSSVQATIPVR